MSDSDTSGKTVQIAGATRGPAYVAVSKDNDAGEHKSPADDDDAQARADALRAGGQSPHDDPAVDSRDQMHHENPETAAEIAAGVVGAGSPTKHAPHHDAGTSHISIGDLQVIARRFAPLVWIDPEEKYRPCTFPSYLSRVNLYYDPTGRARMEEYLLIKEQPTEADLNDAALYALLDAYRARTNDPRLEKLTLDNMVRQAWKMSVRSPEEQEGVEWKDINTVPFISRVRRYHDHWEILYVFTWAYNGPFTVCCKPVDAHSGDIEHVTVRANEDATRLEWVFIGAHGVTDGVWRRPHQIEVERGDTNEPTRPVVYAADHSHGLYSSPGTWWRICGFANDLVGPKCADRHNLWDPQVRLVLDQSDARFAELGDGVQVLRYNGCMSEDGVAAPQSQPFWIEETPYTNNCFRRCWWPCRYISWTGDKDFCYNCCQWKVDFAKGRRPPIASARSPDAQRMV